MTNYSMQKGAERNRKIRFIKIFFFGMMIAWSILFGLLKLVQYWDRQDAKILAIHYCWDWNGEHYIAPNPNCR